MPSGGHIHATDQRANLAGEAGGTDQSARHGADRDVRGHAGHERSPQEGDGQEQLTPGWRHVRALEAPCRQPRSFFIYGLNHLY